MHQPTVVVRECADMYLAETLRSRLAIEGIQAIVTGTDPVLALAFGGAVTNRLLHLEVAEQDYLRAFGILEADERLRDTATAWVCSRCDEQNEPAFELCWSCNKKRDPGDTAGRSATEFNQEPQDNLASITDPDSGGSLPTTASFSPILHTT